MGRRARETRDPWSWGGDDVSVAWQPGGGHAVGEGGGPTQGPFGGTDGYRILGGDDYRGGHDYPIDDEPEERGPYRGVGPRGWQRDDGLRDEVCRMLSDDPWVDASDIEVAVKGLEVTLTGTVETREQKVIADHLAHRAHGVRDVHNHLRLRGQRERA